jgi:hypothetical protein
MLLDRTIEPEDGLDTYKHNASVERKRKKRQCPLDVGIALCNDPFANESWTLAMYLLQKVGIR